MLEQLQHVLYEERWQHEQSLRIMEASIEQLQETIDAYEKDAKKTGGKAPHVNTIRGNHKEALLLIKAQHSSVDRIPGLDNLNQKSFVSSTLPRNFSYEDRRAAEEERASYERQTAAANARTAESEKQLENATLRIGELEQMLQRMSQVVQDGDSQRRTLAEDSRKQASQEWEGRLATAESALADAAKDARAAKRAHEVALAAAEAGRVLALEQARRGAHLARQMQELSVACGEVPGSYRAHADEVGRRLSTLEAELGVAGSPSLQSILPNIALPDPTSLKAKLQRAGSSSAQATKGLLASATDAVAAATGKAASGFSSDVSESGAQVEGAVPKAAVPAKSGPSVGSIFGPVTSDTLLAESAIEASEMERELSEKAKHHKKKRSGSAQAMRF